MGSDQEIRDQVLPRSTLVAIPLESLAGEPSGFALDGIETCPQVVEHLFELSVASKGGGQLGVDDLA
jgi:hypothetical protein